MIAACAPLPRATVPCFADERTFDAEISAERQASHYLRRTAAFLNLTGDVRGLSVLGNGLSYCTVAARVGGLPVVCRMPDSDDLDLQIAQAQAAARLLLRLAERPLRFDLPRQLALIDTPDGTVSVQTRVPGKPCWPAVPRKGLTPVCADPWQRVAEAAAELHRLDPAIANGVLTPRRDAAHHADEQAMWLEMAEAPFMPELRAWASANRPAAHAPALLHGDLMGQNVLATPGGAHVGLIDWEEAQVGDPAYDLAVITRGRRRPFGRPRGLSLLLDAYNALAHRPIERRHVRYHELCLLARWIVESPTETVAADCRRACFKLWQRACAGL